MNTEEATPLFESNVVILVVHIACNPNSENSSYKLLLSLVFLSASFCNFVTAAQLSKKINVALNVRLSLCCYYSFH